MRKMLPSLVRALATVLLTGILPAVAQEPVIQSSDFSVTTSDSVTIHVHRKTGANPGKVPVLLIHGSWCDGRVWDFPGRSVMDYLAVRGYDVYALDLRGMGTSDHPESYAAIDIVSRVQDAAAVAGYIASTTGRAPVVVGWSQGGVITGLLAASAPQLVAGVGFLSVAGDGFTVPAEDVSLLVQLANSPVDRFLPAPPLVPVEVLYGLAFGTDPVTGRNTISADAFNTYVSLSEPDSKSAILELASPDFFNAAVVPAWGAIRVPALVVDGALDALVGEDRAQILFDDLGSAKKQLVIFPRNAHGWFLEDNHNATVRVFDRFLAQFN